MGTSSGPKIITDNLVVLLDTFNNNSYLGKSTTNVIVNPTCDQLPKLSSSNPSNTYGYSSISNEKSYEGKTSLRLSPNQGSSSSIIYFSSGGLSGMQPSQTYTFSFYVYIPSDVNFTSIRILWYDYAPSGNQSQSTYHYNANLIRNQWNRISATRTLRVDTNRSFIYVYWNHSTSITYLGQSIYLDNFQLEQGNQMTSFTTGTSNLMLYPDCELNKPRLLDSSIGGSWLITSQSSDYHLSGTKSLKITRTGINNSRYNLLSNDLSGIVPGKYNVFSFYVYIPSTSSFDYFRIRWYDYIGTSSSDSSTYIYSNSIEKDKWVRVEGKRNIRSDATRSFIYLYWYHSSDVSYHNIPIYLDNLQIEEGETSSRFIDGYRGTTIEENGGLQDIASNSYGGDLINEPLYDNTDNSLILNGINNYISVNYGKDINPYNNSITLSIWIKPNDLVTNSMFISTGQSRGNGNTNQRMYISIYNGKWDWGILTSAWGGGTVSVNTNWNLVTIVIDNISARFYLNGEQIYTKTVNSTFIFNDNIRLGCHDSNYFFNGKLSNFKVYKKTLTNKEIKKNYIILKKRYNYI